MCFLAILWRVVEDAPLLVGANREECYARGGTPPQRVFDRVPFVAGLDPKAGGTWLGVNARGVLVAVTNRAKTQAPKEPRSRGLLARDLLQCTSAAEATALAARELGRGAYAGCNFLVADHLTAQVIHHGDWLRINPLPAGVHVLTTADLNNSVDRRIACALDFLTRNNWQTSGECLDALKVLCARRDDPAICIHGEQGGTVSSSLVALRRPLARSMLWHAQGPPDRTPYADLSALLQQVEHV